MLSVQGTAVLAVAFLPLEDGGDDGVFERASVADERKLRVTHRICGGRNCRAHGLRTSQGAHKFLNPESNHQTSSQRWRKPFGGAPSLL